MKILNYGSLNVDHVYSVDHIVKEGETILSDDLNIFCGGKGLNQSIALAKAGVPVYHAGMIGEDGDLLLDACREYGVNTKYLKKLPVSGGHTVIQVDKKGQNSIILFGGTNQMQTKEYMDYVLSDFNAGDYLLLQNEINLLDYIIDKAYEKGMRIILNPSPFDDKLKKCDFSKIYLFLLNEVEGEQFTGQSEPEKMLKALREKLPDAVCGMDPIHTHDTDAERTDIARDAMTFCVSFAGYDLDKGKDDLVYIAVNTYWEDVRITLPKVYGRVAWHMNVNTWGNGEGKYTWSDEEAPFIQHDFIMKPRSVVVFTGRV